MAGILARDQRYPRAAYGFVQEVLRYATKRRRAAADGHPGPVGHLSGQQLLEAMREHALDEYGPLARRVLAEWNIRRTEDFGTLVFNLIGAGLLMASEEDSPADFADGYDFHTAFTEPFRQEGEPPADLSPIA